MSPCKFVSCFRIKNLTPLQAGSRQRRQTVQPGHRDHRRRTCGVEHSGFSLAIAPELYVRQGNKAVQMSEFVDYRGAPHAFLADYRPSYRQEAAADGFARALAWFKTHGVV